VTASRGVAKSPGRREQLQNAAVWVFARKGYRAASISDILARAGVARGTFYLYFESKEQVFLAIVDTFHRQIRRTLEEARDMADIGTDARALLVSRFTQWLDFFGAQRDAARVVLREAAAIDPRFEKSFSELRRSALDFLALRARHLQDLGLLRATVAPDMLAHLQLGMLDELVHAFVLTDPGADHHGLAEQLVDLLWTGMRPD
jgi:AcrR family transcriptional regulator